MITLLHFVRVTDHDIRSGHRNDPLSCPVALSLARELGRGARVDIDSIDLEAEHGDTRTYRNSSGLVDWLEHFDRGYEVGAFLLQLDDAAEVAYRLDRQEADFTLEVAA